MIYDVLSEILLGWIHRCKVSICSSRGLVELDIVSCVVHRKWYATDIFYTFIKGLLKNIPQLVDDFSTKSHRQESVISVHFHDGADIELVFRNVHLLRPHFLSQVSQGLYNVDLPLSTHFDSTIKCPPRVSVSSLTVNRPPVWELLDCHLVIYREIITS